MERGKGGAMTVKFLGATLIILGCGYCGFSITAAYKREETALRQLIGALDFMQCELQYRMTPLPDLCRQAGIENKNQIGKFLINLADELESQISPDVYGCVRAALACMSDLPKRIVKAFEIMGTSLGRFDAEGQIRGLETVRAYCRSEIDVLSVNRDARLRSYQTLGLCMGAALAILFV